MAEQPSGEKTLPASQKKIQDARMFRMRESVSTVLIHESVKRELSFMTKSQRDTIRRRHVKSNLKKTKRTPLRPLAWPKSCVPLLPTQIEVTNGIIIILLYDSFARLCGILKPFVELFAFHVPSRQFTSTNMPNTPTTTTSRSPHLVLSHISAAAVHHLPIWGLTCPSCI